MPAGRPIPRAAYRSSAQPPSCLTMLLQLEQRELLGRHRDKYDHILREVVARYGTGKLAHPPNPGPLMRTVPAQTACMLVGAVGHTVLCFNGR